MISIVVPVYNEEESLQAFYKELIKVLPSFAKAYEIVFVDDGSTDASLEILKEFAKSNKAVRIFSFRRNQGKAEALTLGFHMTRGETIITLDADLQDKPSEIHTLLEKMSQGFDMVSGWRKDRHDSPATIISSKLFNFFAGLFWGMHLHDYNCGLKAYTKDAAKSLHLYGGMHRFIPLIVFQQGFTVTEVAVSHDVRKFGKSKYAHGFSKIFKNLPDMFTMLFLIKYGKRPLHFFGIMGGLSSLIGIILLVYLSILHYMGKAIGDRPLLFLGMLLILVGFQIFFTGFLAELMINVKNGENSESLRFQLRYSSDREVLSI